MNKNIVEIDKTLLVRRKHEKGCILNQVWLFRGIKKDRKCRGIRVSFMNKNIVEIDKTLLVQRKHEKGHIFNQIWLFGGIEWVSKKNDKNVIFRFS